MQNPIFGIQSDKKNDWIINEEEYLLSKNINITGIYDPADNNLSMDMWKNSNGLRILEIMKKIQNISLSEDASNILNIALLTNSYFPQKTYKLHLRKKVGEGSYGVIYEINKNYVIKLFRNSYADVNQSDESAHIIPFKNENREINFFIQYIKSKQSKSNFFIDVKTIGVILINVILDNQLFKKKKLFYDYARMCFHS